jgi:hypothetical protein
VMEAFFVSKGEGRKLGSFIIFHCENYVFLGVLRKGVPAIY